MRALPFLLILIGVLVDQQWGVFRARRRIAEAASVREERTVISE